jgi:hypothetical protein
MSWLGKLEKARAEMAARDVNPWRLPLERLHGKIGDDGIERVTTQSVFDILGVPQRNRSTAACRRLAKLMTELGWTAVRVRGLTRGGYREQVRGYCRDARHDHRSNILNRNRTQSHDLGERISNGLQTRSILPAANHVPGIFD